MEHKVSYYCTDCIYSFSNNNCDEKIKQDCFGCRMNDNGKCRCTTHTKMGNECPDYTPRRDKNE